MTETNPSSSPRYASYPSVAGRAVLVTGGASGIGASIVEHFARQGARVAFLDIEDGAAEQLIAALKVRVESAPIYFRCDLTDIGALQSAVREAVASLGGVDVLVNNAANDQRHKVEDVTPEYWDASIAVNLRPQFFMIQAVLPCDEGGGARQHHQYVVDLVDDSIDRRAGLHRCEGGDRRTNPNTCARTGAERNPRECGVAGGDCDGKAEAARLYARVQSGDHGEPGFEAGCFAGGCGPAGALSGGG